MTIEKFREAVDEAKEELKEEWDADWVDVHGEGYTVRWDNEVEKPVENVHAMVEEMRSLATKNPDAEISGQANAEQFRISAWFDRDEDNDTEN